MTDIPTWLQVAPEVLAALRSGRPVVALETTVITHGLPRPVNLELARRLEHEVRAAGAVPATAAVLAGQPRLGLSAEDLEHLALNEQAVKVSRRDLGSARALGLTGGTTVSATMILAHAAGVQVFATGGIGGVHRGDMGDVSADLPELARTPVAVVCSGAKSILDLPRTLEWLETAGVPVIGFATQDFPAFFARESGLPVSLRVDDAPQAAAVLRAHWGLGMQSGVVIGVPCPEEAAVSEMAVELAIEAALSQAADQHVQGKELTPFLLARLAEATEGATLRANLALLKNNARVAGQIARALTVPPGP
ncbi:MAG: pseudouridine-5'-phosphate glycosidase [Anaerolineales bacterium]|nr:pseudouridine-5'-phosphate glycosidase [Anaerolineales bacterium]